MSTDSVILTLSCPDRPGIVAAVADVLLKAGCNIADAQQYGDEATGVFFMRVVFSPGEPNGAAALPERFTAVAEAFAMRWSMRPRAERRRVLILASKFDHCLADLLYRWRIDELPMDLVGVVSNHPAETYEHVDLSRLPFHHLPVTPETREAQEAALERIIEDGGVELVVLARYMQVLSPRLAGSLKGRCINIHHSFLPSFTGARPYKQAIARGVKVIGATAHYVTGELDQGPIIEQDVERISHRDTEADLVRKGRDIERRVLARAVRWHLEDRILINDSKTVVFTD